MNAIHNKWVTLGTMQKYVGTNQAQSSQFLWNLSWNYAESIPIHPSQPEKTNLEGFPQASCSLRGDNTDSWLSRPTIPDMTLRGLFSYLSDDTDCDDVENADQRNWVRERGLSNGELESEVMHILSDRLHSPRGERIGRHTRVKPIGEGFRGCDVAVQLGDREWQRGGHGGGAWGTCESSHWWEKMKMGSIGFWRTEVEMTISNTTRTDTQLTNHV